MPPPLKLSSPETHDFWQVEVLHEDDHLLALDKPVDLPCTPLEENPTRPSLMSLLHRAIEKKSGETESRNLSLLRPVYNLEPNIGGVFLLAKTEPALIHLKNVIGEERPFQEFTALTRGTPKEDVFDLLLKMEPEPDRPEVMRTSKSQGKRSRTLVQVIERFRDYVLLNCQPLTQRQHQVRAHLKFLRLPVVGDRVYGASPLFLSRIKPEYRLKSNQKERPLIARPALHATRIRFNHPATGEPTLIESTWAKDFAVSVKYLRKYWAVE